MTYGQGPQVKIECEEAYETYNERKMYEHHRLRNRPGD
jgi:hypothetical protein